MVKNPKHLKTYLNKNGLRFQINEKRVWGYIETVFGRKRAEELSQIFDETYVTEGKSIEANKKYKFCSNFEEATTLMYFQSDWFLKNSNIILDYLLKSKPTNILELGCYTGIFSNYISEILNNSDITGVDIEKNLISFGNDKYKKNNLKLIELDYQNLNNLNTKFDYIFTNFGIENIPEAKKQTYKIRENNDYKKKLIYFSDLFSSLNSVSNDNTEFLCIARIPNVECILAIVDGAQSKGWEWLTEDLEYIDLNLERVPKLRFRKKSLNKISLENFSKEIKKLKINENNSIDLILQYEKEKDNLELVHQSSFKYDNNDELFYEIYNENNLVVVFIWTNVGHVEFKKFKNKKELDNFFYEEYGLEVVE